MRPLILAFALLAVAGCTAAPAPRPQVSLPPVPEDIRACAARYVPAPKGTSPLTERQLYRLIADLKSSNAAKSGCLARLIALYEAQSAIVLEALR